MIWVWIIIDWCVIYIFVLFETVEECENALASSYSISKGKCVKYRFKLNELECACLNGMIKMVGFG